MTWQKGLQLLKIISPFLLGVGLLAVWSLTTRVVPQYLLPSPASVVKSLYTNSANYCADSLVTLSEALLGLAVASVLVAVVLALIVTWRPAARLFVPMSIVTKVVPSVALAPLFIVWFGNGLLSKVALTSLVCFFPVLIGALEGLRRLPMELKESARIWGAKRWPFFWHVERRFTLPYVTAGYKTAAPLAVVGALVAEYSGADRGLGHLILISAYRLDTETMFAAILLSATLGMAAYALTAQVSRRMLRKARFTDADLSGA